MLITTKTLTELTGYTSQNLNLLARNGIIDKSKHGKWELEIVLPKLIDYKVKLAVEPYEKKIDELKADDADRRLKMAKAINEELELELKMKRMALIEDVEDLIVKFASTIAHEVGKIGKTAKRKFKFAKTDNERFKILQDAEIDTLNGIAEFDISKFLPNTGNDKVSNAVRTGKKVSRKSKAKRKS